MTSAYDIIIRPLITEKCHLGITEKRYAFIVAKKATKFEVRAAVEQLFGVKVDRVNVVNYDGKIKRMGKNEGAQPSYKKAYVNLAKDSKPIEFFESLQ
jgi:large subunit ribosomal protein L23